jgi:Protein of unknown function (DUF3306)
MTPKPDAAKESAEAFSLRRWSRRKLDAARAEPAATPAADLPAAPAAATPAAQALPPVVAELPPVESLTPESDFTAFFKPQVDEVVKRAALKQLFRDPRFNVMDGLDIYIDDYTKADPIPADVLKQLVQARYIFDPPPTELTPEGHVVDAAVAPAEDAPGLPPPADTASAPPVEADAPSAPGDNPADAKR